MTTTSADQIEVVYRARNPSLFPLQSSSSSNMQPQAAVNTHPKTFADLLVTVQSGADVEPHYYEFKDPNELAQSLNAHNVQTLASIIEARPAAFSPWGIALCNATIGDDVAPLIFSLRTVTIRNLSRIELSNLHMGDACMAALARAITAECSDARHHGLNMLKS